MHGKWSCVHIREVLFDNASFFWDLEYFYTFVSFQSLNIFNKLWNEQMMQIKNFRAAAGKKNLTTPRNTRQGLSRKIDWKSEGLMKALKESISKHKYHEEGEAQGSRKKVQNLG